MNKISEADKQPYLFHPHAVEKYLFLLIISIEALIFIYLTFAHRLVAGHDGFHAFTMLYSIFNQVANYGEIPQWSPFMMHGTIFIFTYVIAGGILEKVLLLLGGALQSFNFLTLFHVSLFFDELVLIVGVWLLARRFFVSPFTRFFVALSIMGSCIWFLQPLYNFYIYYSIPLILHFIHQFFDSGKNRYLFLGGNLLLMQSFGNLPHFLPIISLIIFLYFLFYSICNQADMWKNVKKIRFNGSFVIISVCVILSFVIVIFFMKFGTTQMASYSLRKPDGSVSLSQFLTYGGPFKWEIWLESLLGVSPCVDYTLYSGILCVPLIFLGLILNTNKQNVHFFLTAIVLLLFSMGSFVSVFFYHCWPMMKYYRHIVSISPIIKVFLCFLAGIGLESFLVRNPFCEKPLRAKMAVPAMVLFLIVCALFTLYFSGESFIPVNFFKSIVPHMSALDLIQIMVPKYLPKFLILFNKGLLCSLMTRTAFFALSGSFVLLFAYFVFEKNIKIHYWVILLLAVHSVDLYSFKFFEIQLKTVPLNEEVYSIAGFQKMPYVKRRDLTFWDNNPRAEMLRALPVVTDSGSFYSPVHAFLFKDQLGNPFRTDFWMLPLDNYMRAYWGQDINDLTIKPKGLVHRSETEYPRFDFPDKHPAILKISGITEDKIQFFSQAVFLSSADDIVSKITDPDYTGDILFLTPLERSGQNNSAASFTHSGYDLSANKRLHFAYQIDRFDCNHIVVSTDVGDAVSAWLLYSDAWHPLWRATVNGKNTPVYKANLAYKAVKLDKGFNEVHFYFKSGFINFFHYVIGINSLFWLIALIYLVGKIAIVPTGFDRKCSEICSTSPN